MENTHNQLNQLDKLDDRVTRLEERLHDEIGSLHIKIDSLSAMISKALLDSSRHACPSPGSCVPLSISVRTLETAHRDTVQRMDRIDARMMEMERWQGRMIGGLALLMTLLTLFAPSIRKLLNLD